MSDTTPYLPNTRGLNPEEAAAQYPPQPSIPQAVNNPVSIPPTPEPANIPAPQFDPDSEHEVTNEEKLDRVFRFVEKFESLLDSIQPEQIERVSQLASNPIFGKMFGRK